MELPEQILKGSIALLIATLIHYMFSDRTRELATDSEYSQVLWVNGCAGFLIAPHIGGSAAHCRKENSVIRAGTALLDNSEQKATVTKTLEVNSRYDFWFFEIKWETQYLPPGMELVGHILTDENELPVASDFDTEKLYTLGFPIDFGNQILVYAEGVGKSFGPHERMRVSLNVTYGNSGGALWRSRDGALVGIISEKSLPTVDDGRQLLSVLGIQNYDNQDPDYWNYAVPIWKVYKESKILKQIFPSGKSTYLYPKTH